MTDRPRINQLVPYAGFDPSERPIAGAATAAREQSEGRVLRSSMRQRPRDRQRIAYAREQALLRRQIGEVQDNQDRP